MADMRDGVATQPNSTTDGVDSTTPRSMSWLSQMTSTMQLASGISGSSQIRMRRSSDTDVATSEDALPTRTQSTAVLSKDGSTWVAAPDSKVPGRIRGDTLVTEDPDAPMVVLQHACACKSAVCPVKKVLGTTELLEIVLSSLQTPRILALRRINRQWEATIQQSPQLRLHFFTYGQWSRPSSQFQLLPLTLPGLSFERGRSIHQGQWISISFTPEVARRISGDPKPTCRPRSRSIFEGIKGGLGSKTKAAGSWPDFDTATVVESTLKYEDLLVTQPPLVGMQAFIVTPRKPSMIESEKTLDHAGLEVTEQICAKISREAGITLGFLAETAHSIITSSDPTPSSIADAKIVFKAIVSFTEPQTSRKKRSTATSVVLLT